MKRCIVSITCLLLLVLPAGRAKADEISTRPAIPAVAVTTDNFGNATFAGPDLQYIGQAGEPAIPFKIVHLLLPSDTDMTTIHVNYREIKTDRVPGQWYVSPLPPPAFGDEKIPVPEWPPGKRIVDGKDMDIYGSDTNFPDSLIGRTSSGSIRHWKLIEVPVALFQYKPASGLLDRLVEIELVVFYTRRSSTAPRFSRFFSNDSESIKRVKALTANFADIAPRDGLYNLQPSAPADAAPAYVIITTEAIAAESSELVNFQYHKEQRGYNVQVATEDEWGGGTGDTAAENIRSWLQKNYQDRNIQYVLLIGNPHPTHGDVPMKMLWPRSNDSSHRESPSDFYYADLTGNWDIDGDGMFGEWNDDFGADGVDRYWEVRVGRIPYYGNIEDLDHILSKIVHYQNETGDAAQWRKQVLLPMKRSDSDTPGYHLGEAIKDMVISAKCDWDYYRIYDDDYGLTLPPESVPCNTDTVTEAWNATLPGAVFWWSHGSLQSAYDIMDTTHTATLDDDYPVFTFQASCYNSFPENASNLSYALLKNGALAAIGATRVSWYYIGETFFAGSPSNSGMTFEYANRLIEGAMDSGTALNDIKESISVHHSALWMNYTVMNIYGDPETGLAMEEDIIIDNGDPGTSSSGFWEPCDAYYPYDVDAMCTTEPDARYIYEVPLKGLYAVDLWSSGQNNSCSDVAMHIYDGDSYLDTIRIDQRNNPGQWNGLDAFYFSDTARIVIRASGGCTTSADAVRFSPRYVFFVDGDRPTSGDGSSWSEAFQSIQEAVDAACVDSEIWIKKGRYLLSDPININKRVYLYGGFQGHETLRRTRDWKQHITIIDGQAKVQCIRVAGDATIDGFTITNGRHENTGGMHIGYDRSPRIENVLFYKNHGRAVLNAAGTSSTFNNCAFIENSTKYSGGGIWNSSEATITNCLFSKNTAEFGGGGIYNYMFSGSSSTKIFNCIFTNNSGGAISNHGSQPIITHCTIVGNSEFGIANTEAQPTVTNSILWNNPTQIINDGGSSATVSYSAIDQDGYAGTDGNLRQAPQFVSPAEDDFRLSATSPCIDTGHHLAAQPMAVDFNGGPRIIDGDGDGVGVVDMGALEAFITATGTSIDIRALSGTRITQCSAVDPATIEAMPNRPDNMTQGLIRFGARVHEPGAQAAYRMVLPQPVSQNQRWFMYSEDLGWIDFSREVISDNIGDGAQFNDDRSEVTIYLTDNGPYDDDPAPGIVADPTGPGTPGLPDLSTDPGTMSFGTVQIGETALQSLAITNQGTANLEIGKISISGANASEFEIMTDTCSGNRFAYSESGTVGIRFFPAGLGTKSAAVTIESNDPDAAALEVPLTGTGITPPAVTNLEISGPERVAESSGAQYVCMAYFSDGTHTDVSDMVQWSADSPDATIDNRGYLTTGKIDDNQQCTLQATYKKASHSMSHSIVVTIVNTVHKSGGGGGSGCFIDALTKRRAEK